MTDFVTVYICNCRIKINGKRTLLLYSLVLHRLFYFAMVYYFFFSILSKFTAFKPFILQPNELNVLKKDDHIHTKKRPILKT